MLPLGFTMSETAVTVTTVDTAPPVALARRLCAPAGTFAAGMEKAHLPVLSEVVVPAEAPSINTVMVAFAGPVPVTLKASSAGI